MSEPIMSRFTMVAPPGLRKGFRIRDPRPALSVCMEGMIAARATLGGLTTFDPQFSRFNCVAPAKRSMRSDRRKLRSSLQEPVLSAVGRKSSLWRTLLTITSPRPAADAGTGGGAGVACAQTVEPKPNTAAADAMTAEIRSLKSERALGQGSELFIGMDWGFRFGRKLLKRN